MTFPPLLLVQTGTPPDDVRHPHGDFPLWFRRVTGDAAETEIVRVFEGEPLPPPDANRVAIITGSWAMVTDRLPWSELTAQWIRDAVAIDMPLFGVCYGHQLMAYALGGRVDYHPRGREVGCQTIRLSAHATNDSLLSNCPPIFTAHLMHEQKHRRTSAACSGAGIFGSRCVSDRSLRAERAVRAVSSRVHACDH